MVACHDLIEVTGGTPMKDDGDDVEKLELFMIPCQGRIMLDKVDENLYQLTDLVTGARAKLRGSCELDFDEEGFCAVVGTNASGEDMACLPADLLKNHLRRCASGKCYIVQGDGGAGQAISFNSHMARYKDARISLRIGSTSAKFDMNAYVFAAARAGGARVFWGLFDLYRALRLTTFANQPCKWVNACMPKWSSICKVFVDGCHIVRSKHWNTAKETLDNIPWYERCLPQPSLSSISLLALTLQFAHARPAAGGLKSTEARAAAGELAKSLIRIAMGRQHGVLVDVLLAEEWRCRWPRPNVLLEDKTSVVQVTVGTDGTIDMTALHAEATTGAAEMVRRRWVAALARHGWDGSTASNLIDLLSMCCGVKVLAPLFHQLLFAVSLQLELALADQHRGDSATDDLSFEFKSWAPEPGDGNMEEKLYQYTVASCMEAARHRVFSCAVDKASPCQLALLNGAVVFPNNLCAMLCPQVDTGFCSDHLDIEGDRHASRKRALVHDEEDVLPPQAKRQRAWLRRDRAGADHTAWRPLTLHRTAAKKFCLALDNALRVSTGLSGLAAFQYNSRSAGWSKWAEWPGLGLAIDMGSDGVAAFFALVSKDLNMWLWPDPSHSAARTFKAVLTQMHLQEFILLMLITWNLEHGPRSDQGRRSQLRAALGDLYERSSPDTCPLFQHLAPGIIADLEAADIVQFPREEPVEVELWRWLKQRTRTAPVGRRIAMNRFGAAQHAAMANRPFWQLQLFERTYLALESGFLKGKKFDAKLTVKRRQTETFSEGVGPTDGKRLQVEDRSLRGCCENAVVISVLSLDDMHHRRVIDALVQAQLPLDRWHTEQNRILRDTMATERWLIAQVRDGFRAHLVEYFVLLQDASVLVECGFALPHLLCGPQDASRDAGTNMMVVAEDEHAELFGQLCLSFACQRAIRGLFNLSWPTRMIGALGGDAENFLKEFAADLDLFRELEALPGKGADTRLVLKRSVFNLRCVKQLVAALEEGGQQMTDGLAEVLRARARACVQTQIIEDFNGTQKNHTYTASNRRFRKPSVCMSACLSSDVIANRHKFQNVRVDTAARSFDAKLPNNAFQADSEQRSMSFDWVVGTNATPEWFSPGPATIACPHSDLALLRAAKSAGSLHMLQHSWLMQVCKMEHQIALGFVRDGQTKWYVALHAFPKSAALFWAVDLVRVPGTSRQWLQFRLEPDALCLHAVFDISADRVQALSFVWRSVLWQQQTLPSAAFKGMATGVRAFVSEHGVKSVPQIACLHAWWSMPRSIVLDYCKYLGVHIESGADLLEVLLTVIMSQLGLSEEAALDIVHQRLATADADTTFSAALLELDEAIDIIDPVDHEAVKAAQKSAESSLESRNVFKQSYTKRVKTVREAAAAREQPSRRKVAKKPSTTTTTTAIPHHCDQPAAKRLLPPGASIWRSLVRGEWCAHYPPFRRITEPFLRNGGSEGALRACLVRVWSQHLEKHGLPTSACWVEGLFPSGGSSSSGSSSSTGAA